MLPLRTGPPKPSHQAPRPTPHVPSSRPMSCGPWIWGTWLGCLIGEVAKRPDPEPPNPPAAAAGVPGIGAGPRVRRGAGWVGRARVGCRGGGAGRGGQGWRACSHPAQPACPPTRTPTPACEHVSLSPGTPLALHTTPLTAPHPTPTPAPLTPQARTASRPAKATPRMGPSRGEGRPEPTSRRRGFPWWAESRRWRRCRTAWGRWLRSRTESLATSAGLRRVGG
jgi:hypothetical protein